MVYQDFVLGRAVPREEFGIELDKGFVPAEHAEKEQ
jgi:hypothetical protein